jgi:hypothetical protein
METIAIAFTMAATSRGLLQFPATFQRIDADVSAWGWQLSVIFSARLPRLLSSVKLEGESNPADAE